MNYKKIAKFMSALTFILFVLTGCGFCMTILFQIDDPDDKILYCLYPLEEGLPRTFAESVENMK
jgi:hypothetical protein